MDSSPLAGGTQQNKKFQAQIEQDAEQDYRARKAQLISIIYDTREDRGWLWGKATREPSASLRARQEAVIALVDSELTYFRGATGTDLTHASLAGADFDHAYLHGTRFGEAHMSGASFEAATLNEADLQYARLDYALFKYTDLRRANLFHADLLRAVFEGADLRGAHLDSSSLRNSSISHSDLRDADLNGAHLQDSTIIRSSFRGSVLHFADLSGVRLFECSLQGADLGRTEGLRIDQVSEAYWDKSTIWPDGFRDQMTAAGLPLERLPPDDWPGPR